MFPTRKVDNPVLIFHMGTHPLSSDESVCVCVCVCYKQDEEEREEEYQYQ